MKGLLFIPVYNQVYELPALLSSLKNTTLPVDHVLLVNNGSDDGSEKLISQSGFDYLDVDKNRGIGYSFILATKWALEKGFDFFVVLASNGKMLPSEMGRVVDPIKNKSADYVTGSRYLKGGSYPRQTLFRKIVIPLVTKIICITYQKKITDATCGYKAYRLDIFEKLNINWEAKWLYTYGFEYYLYAKVLCSPHKTLEVPITMKYPKDRQRVSKMRPFIGWWHMARPWIVAWCEEIFHRKSSTRDNC